MCFPFLIVPLLKFNLRMDPSSSCYHPQAMASGSQPRKVCSRHQPFTEQTQPAFKPEVEAKLYKMENRFSK
ncbi:hypothetical protein DPMN_051604 [Dreissena polymorpha]|uniref:Uncharacterized protein n=2 Tax=Dreissena polymorpha TaxID=45954 RepID=A0A9D4HP46_DREPO|nr:hypothetical protein DPMN_051604 [Dreissena polymorpha]